MKLFSGNKDNNEKLEAVRHSLAHLLATVVSEYDPKVKFAIGPSTDNGFYYDFEFSKGCTPNVDDFPVFEARIQELIAKKLDYKKIDVTEKDARERFKDQPYKLDLIDEIIERKEPLTLYQTGDFIDLCKGGHVKTTGDINGEGFIISRIAGAYWKGNEKNKMLTRIYGLAFNNKKELDAYIKQQEEAQMRDHKKLGKELDLFYIDEMVGKGLPMWTPKETIIKYELENFTRNLERKYGYEHVSTPYLGSEALYKTSGHLDHYSENMYAPIDMDGDVLYLRPMACPHHIRMLLRKPISYRDLPVRYAEIADYNRYEKSGELMGMIRVRKFQLTDAHIFVSNDGLKEEFKNVCSLVAEGMKGLGLDDIVSYRFSKRDPKNKDKYFPDDTLWEKAESTMKEALDEIGFKYTEALDEAAFYGPKLDVQAKNVNGKEDTLFTAQIDFLLPEKFDITYTDEDGKKKRPVMIHRSAIGSLERTFAFLIEHYGGIFPLWLSPVQVKVLPIGESHKEYAKSVVETLKKENLRATVDESNETLGKKIRQCKLEKIPYMLIIGDKEVKENKVTIESRDEGNLGSKNLKDTIEKLLKEIDPQK